MLKKIFISVVFALFSIYLIVAVTMFNNRPADQVCRDVVLVIKDTMNAGFVTQREITDMLHNNSLDPVGKQMDDVKTLPIEEVLSKHVLIDEVEVYKTLSGKLRVEVTQRIPILRIMSRNGENYYIDNKGKVMPMHIRCISHLPVVTGFVEKSYAMGDLYRFGLFLHKNKFWDAQIEQIHVSKNKEVELVPRVGDHIVFLGKLQGFDNKLDRLKRFYQNGLNKVGWNKYSRINLEFDNQIVCTKWEQEEQASR